jgi:hypothetical protein
MRELTDRELEAVCGGSHNLTFNGTINQSLSISQSSTASATVSQTNNGAYGNWSSIKQGNVAYVSQSIN